MENKELEYRDSKTPCVDCQQGFQVPVQRGRPPTRCPDCKGKFEANKAAVQAAPKAPSNRPSQFDVEVKMWEGREYVCTRADLPKGREAQCPLCMRIFTSDTVTELHKPYRMPKTTHCKNPASLGMVLIERRGLPIWTMLSEPQESVEDVDE